ncbi:MAG TPA: glycosyltransferase [Bryobacteraceae bacterium]|nr:glycosyltransferase [Bryobacteraceae bacterium]
MCDPTLSVVIATYGAAPHLSSVLQALADQTDKRFDVVVVDNNEHPRARPICELFGKRVAFLHLPHQGLSAARNAGIAATHGQYIAFLDDDSVPEPAWAAQLQLGLRRYQCAAAGGRVELAVDGSLPVWYPEQLRCLLSELRYDAVDIPAITDLQYVVGANFCVARRCIEAIGGFRLDLGRHGSCLRSCEEVELCKRIMKSGGCVAFLAAPVVWHRVPSQRCTFSYAMRRSIWQGRSDARLEALHGRPAALGDRSDLRNMLAFAYRTLLLCSDRSGAVVAAANTARQYGYLLEYIKIRLALSGGS